MDSQPNLHLLPEISSSTDLVFPEILIPSEWFLPSSLSDADVSIAQKVRDPCRICSWDGTLETLFHFNNFAHRGLHELRPSQCVSCKLLFVSGHSVLEKILDRHLDTSPSDAKFSDVKIIVWGTYFMTTPNQNIPGQRVISIVHDPTRFRGASNTGFYVFIPTGQHLGAPPSGLPNKRILSGSISSTSSASWARKKLEACLGAHETCSLSENQLFLPTRLVDVRPLGPEGNAKLIRRLDLPDGTRYAALSYVWGNENLQEHIKTTKSSLKSHMNEIVLSSLPKTLRDAVIFTRHLGLDFLWVDSLCIIQNDPDEWEHEAGRMYGVYKNAFVMLGALWGKDCDSGLFDHCADWQSQQIATLRLGQDTWPLHVSREHEVVQLNYSWSDGEPPLLTRAWCFQERLVPSRCIFFGRSELIFGCHEGVGCECDISYGALRYPSSNRHELVPLENKSDIIHLPLSSWSDHGLRWVDQDPETAWRQVVEEYCFRGLTSEKDRLIAIGAVAEQLSYARSGEQYLAGLWSNTLLLDLCWWVPLGNWHKGEEPGRKTPIPSWSWASRAKNVCYGGVDLITPTAEIVQVSCKYKNENPFGVLLESKLILRGRIMSWWPGTTGKRSMSERGVITLFGSNGTSIHSGSFKQDGPHWQEIPRGTFLFELGHWSGDSLMSVFLVLNCRDEENSIFSREAIISPGDLRVGTMVMEDARDLSEKFDKHRYVRECTIV